MTPHLTARGILWPLVALAVAAGMLLVPSHEARAVTQGIAGTLSGAGVGPIQGAVWVVPVDPSVKVTTDLQLSPCDFQCNAFSADASGNFSGGLPIGEYWLYFTPFSGDGHHWAPEWWQDSVTRQDSTKVTVTAGAVTTVNAELSVGGTIAGTIAQAQGDHAGVVQAWIPDPTFPRGYFLAGSGSTDENGDYEIWNLPSTSYRLHFAARQARLEGWWQGQTTAATSTPVAVTAPDTVSGIDPTLSPWGSFTGRVTRASDGTAVAGVEVNLFRVDPFASELQPSGGAVTAADGTYTFPAEAGSYHPWFRKLAFQDEYWNNASTWQAGQDVVVQTSQQTSGIDVALEPDSMVNQSRPAVAGAWRVGSLLTASTGTWYPAAASFAYQWYRGGVPIPAATQRTYFAGPADAGRLVWVRVAASKPGLLPTSAYADGHVVARGVLTLTSTAAIRGTTSVGSILRAVPPRTAPSATATYQWLRNGRPIGGATRQTYRLTKADRGKRMAVRVTLSRSGYITVVRKVVRAVLVR